MEAWRAFFLLVCCTIANVYGEVTQAQLNNIAESLKIEIEVTDNLETNGAVHTFRMTWQNTGNTIIKGDNWIIYFYSFFMIEHEHLPNKNGYEVPGTNLVFHHIKGCLFSMQPNTSFEDMPVNSSRTFEFTGQNWAVSRSDINTNWYIDAANLEPRLLNSTAFGSKFVRSFSTFRQWKRYRNDRYNPFSPRDRYDRYRDSDTTDQKLVIPTPIETHVISGDTLDVGNGSWTIQRDPEAEQEAQYLAKIMKLPVTNISQSDTRAIRLRLDASLTVPESYELTTNASAPSVTIAAANTSGLFYGIQTLLSLMHDGEKKILPEVVIKDHPRYHFRGMHFDIARNFHDKNDIIRVLTVMAKYKMNKLHLHFTDDEGWRIEIPGLQELTDIGSKRCHDLNETKCLIPQLGSGPDTTTSGSGYLTMEDYKEIIRFAHQNHIEVIPEFDSPGHARAAIIAMENRYQKHHKMGHEAMANEYRLVDPVDNSSYFSIQMFTDNAINPCLNSTYKFMDKIITELKKAHKEAGQELKIFHFGGDEVASGAWINSASCQSLLKTLPPSSDSKFLKRYFVEQVGKLVKDHGLSMAGWEDGWLDGSTNPYNITVFDGMEVITNAWDNVWEWQTGERAYKMANAGYKVILGHVTHLYFDHPYEPDPEERGLYWGTRFADTRKTFSYLPDHLYENIAVRRSGEVYTKKEVCRQNNVGCPSLQKPDNIIGMQGNMFSETIVTSDLVDYMVFPRLLAVAERAWHKAPWEDNDNVDQRNKAMSQDWQLFANALGKKELGRLDALNVKYRVPPPGARVENDKVMPWATFPGLHVEYQNETMHWDPVPSEGVAFNGRTKLSLRTKSVDGLRTSREVEVLPVPMLRPADQATVNYLADHVDFKVTVIDNTYDDNYSKERMTIKNTGSETIPAQKWEIYFDNIRLVQPVQYPYPAGYLYPSAGLRLFHVGGSLYRLTPDRATFKPLKAGDQITVDYIIKYFQCARTDFMPNQYVTAEAMTPKVIKSTQGEQLSYVGDFTQEKQWKRSSFDRYNPFTPATRYNKNDDVTDTGYDKVVRVIPTPKDMDIDFNRRVTITKDWVVMSNDEFKSEVQWLADKFGISVKKEAAPHRFEFVKDTVNVSDVVQDEAYMIKIDAEKHVITITANQKSGAFYALQTLYRLSDETEHGREIPSGTIMDGPRFGYRGMHLDVGRNFHSKEEVQKLLDVMATYKLNKFHFHLSEDEGWRLEIPGLPELTDIGSKRCHDVTESKCILPQIGSGPGMDTSGTGFYTVSDYKEILQYAHDRHIEVIPEFDMPGHSRAAIKAMEARQKKTKDSKYILTDPDDTSVYKSVQWFTDNAINPCIETTYVFINHVITEVMNMHKDIQPLQIYNFGGDEVAAGAWTNSSKCQEFMRNKPDINNVSDLKKYFFFNVSMMAESHGLDVAAWEDGLIGEDKKTPFNLTDLTSSKHVYGFAWDNIWEAKKADRAYNLANSGYKVILNHATHLYFDHPYEPDPEERGYYWATRYTDTRKSFGYIPDNFYWNAETKTSGEPIDITDVCGTQCLKLQKPENIIGMQGCLWSETVRTNSQMEFMIFPRLLALAERAWHKASWESEENKQRRNTARDQDWGNFANALGYRELRFLDSIGIRYRIPVPGAVHNMGVLKVNTVFPGLPVEYSTDAGVTWKLLRGYVKMNSGVTVHLRTRSADNTRHSRAVKLNVRYTNTVPPEPSKGNNLVSPAWFLAFTNILFSCLWFLF